MKDDKGLGENDLKWSLMDNENNLGRQMDTIFFKQSIFFNMLSLLQIHFYQML